MSFQASGTLYRWPYDTGRIGWREWEESCFITVAFVITERAHGSHSRVWGKPIIFLAWLVDEITWNGGLYFELLWACYFSVQFFFFFFLVFCLAYVLVFQWVPVLLLSLTVVCFCELITRTQDRIYLCIHLVKSRWSAFNVHCYSCWKYNVNSDRNTFVH